MSGVLKNDRAETQMQFVMTARELLIYSIRKVKYIPKTYRFSIAQPIVDLARQIHTECKVGNSIYPTNAHEVQVRRDHLMQARALCFALISEVEIAKEVIPNLRDSLHWMKLVSDEIKLLDGVLKKDKQRYKNIK